MKLANKALLAAALGLAIAGPALAQDDSSALFSDSASDATAAAPAAASAAPAETGFTLGLAGDHEFGYRMPVSNADDIRYAGEMKTPYFSNEFDLSVQDKDVKLVSNWKVKADPLASDSSSLDGSWSDLVKARALENYVSWSPSGFKFTTGYQLFSWGVADKKNPTDNLNPRDYTVGVNADKIPVLAADAIWYPSDSVSVEGVFLPTAQESEYPVDFKAMVDGSAKLLTSTISSNLVAAYGAYGYTGFSYGATDTGAMAFSPKNSIAGGKLSFRSSSIDCSVSYLYDIDPLYTPVVEMSKNALGLPTGVSISLERERIHRFGLDAKTTAGKFGLWAEAAYSLTQNSGDSDDYAYRRSKLDYVLGTDLNFGPNDLGYANIQYFGAWIPGYDDGFYEDVLAGKITDPEVVYQRALVEALGLDTEGLLQGATVNVKYEIADATFTPQLTAVLAVPFQYDEKNASNQDVRRYCSCALNPEIDVKPVDSFHIYLGANLAYAWEKIGDGDVRLNDSTDKIGSYTPSNNVYLKILYKWNYDLKK
jgi:hypothetical protein